jgi:mono/diheme cytochrome c family protein
MVTRIFVGLLVFMAIMALVAVVALGEADRMEEFDASFEARSVENGAALFQGNCDRCHGVQGRGIAGFAPPLNDYNFFTNRLEEVGYTGSLRSYIESTIAAGRPVMSGEWPEAMPTWGEEYGGPLADYEIENLVDYIMNWQPAAVAAGPEATPVPVTGSPVERGEAVFLGQGGCAGCHVVEGLEGAVGQVGPELTNIATVAAERVEGMTAEAYLEESILQPSAYLVEECPTGPCADIMPKDLGTRLAAEEIEDLITYLLTLE